MNAGDGGSIKLVGTLIDNRGQGVDSITFANGTIWNRTQTTSNVAAVAGTSGNETILETTGDELILAGLGNDTLTGQGGNDVFVFETGFGKDIITDFSGGAGIGDVLRFSSDVFADMSAVIANLSQVGSDTVITYDASNSITLKNVLASNLHANDLEFV